MTLTYFEEDSVSFDAPERIPVGVLMNWAGAVVSFALMAGLAVWGYQLLVRDVTGVPVVRALEGPMRVAPDDPGGVQADYQGLSVTQVASEGAEETPTERVVLAPPPVQLTEEDLPMAALIPDTPSAPATPAETDEPKSAIELAIAEALGGTLPGEEVKSEPETAPVVDGARIRVIPASVQGVAQSPRPLARPARAVPQVQKAAVIADLPSGEADATAIPAGTRLVQLGAYPSAEEARTAWDELDATFGDFLDGKTRVVQEATAGGSTFYRLRAMGFEDLNDARRFCAVLVAQNANCIPVIRR